MVVHGQQAEQVIVVLGDGLARPVLVRRSDLELLIAATELHHRAPHLCGLCNHAIVPDHHVAPEEAGRVGNLTSGGTSHAPASRHP